MDNSTYYRQDNLGAVARLLRGLERGSCIHAGMLTSDFPARLGLKAGSAAQLLEASGLSNLKPEPVFQASKGLGLSRPANPGFPA